MENERTAHLRAQGRDIFPGGQAHIARQIVAMAVYAILADRRQDRRGDILAKHERQRVSSFVPSHAMAFIGEKADTGVIGRAALAHHHGGAQDANRQGAFLILGEKRDFLDALGAGIIGALPAIGIDRGGTGDDFALVAEIERGDGAEMHQALDAGIAGRHR